MITLNSNQVKRKLIETLPYAELMMLDANYLVPTSKWLTGTFSADLWENFMALGIRYSEQRCDCDNYALLAQALANTSHNRSTSEGAGLAFGVLFLKSFDFGHVMNIAIVDESLDLVIYEPQTRRITPLTQEIIECATFVLL
jgi:hypothetical protein